MILIVRKRFRVYRKFNDDVWGLEIVNEAKPIGRVFRNLLLKKDKQHEYRLSKKKRYSYSFVKLKEPVYWKRLKKNFRSLRLVRYFYLTITKHTFKKYNRLALRKRGSYVDKYLYFIEGRLMSLLYRTYFVSNLFSSKVFISTGFFCVGNKIIQACNYLVPLGFLVRLRSKFYGSFFRYWIFKKVITEIVLVNIPRYIVISFSLLLFLW